MTPWRWLEDPQPGSPESNMATDAALFDALRGGLTKVPTIRVYLWDRPSVSYGRLQSEEAVERHYPNLPRVRRPTGGRAVLHGSDLTITAVLLTSHLPELCGPGIHRSYKLILAGVVQALRQFGVPTELGAANSGRAVKNIVDCFDMVDGCDLVDIRTGCKILGSAQRREGEAILQQMSLPLSVLPDVGEFIRLLRRTLQDALGIEGWQTIDTSGRVWYTENEESEGCPWRVKF